jgi:hypothetical protein
MKSKSLVEHEDSRVSKSEFDPISVFYIQKYQVIEITITTTTISINNVGYITIHSLKGFTGYIIRVEIRVVCWTFKYVLSPVLQAERRETEG